MKLGLIAGYSPATMTIPMDLIHEAENLGFSSVWTAEAWGSDAVSPAAWILAQTERIQVGTAIMQRTARSARGKRRMQPPWPHRLGVTRRRGATVGRRDR